MDVQNSRDDDVVNYYHRRDILRRSTDFQSTSGECALLVIWFRIPGDGIGRKTRHPVFFFPSPGARTCPAKYTLGAPASSMAREKA